MNAWGLHLFCSGCKNATSSWNYIKCFLCWHPLIFLLSKSSVFCVVQILSAEKEAHEKIANSSDMIFVLRCKLVCNCNPYCVHSIVLIQIIIIIGMSQIGFLGAKFDREEHVNMVTYVLPDY
jgi:hypothetical protein